MAFNFNTLNQTLGQTNIFDPNSSNSQGTNGQQSIVRTSIPSPQAPSVTGGAPSPNQGAAINTRAPMGYTPNRTAQVYSGIKGSDTSKSMGNIDSGIKSAEDKLQQRANEYSQATDSLKSEQAFDMSKLDKALSGDSKEFNDVSTRLGQSLPSKQVDAFEGLKDEELPTLADPLKNQSSFGEIFRDTSGPQYTRGQSNFEDMLLGRNFEFRKLAESLAAKQDALSKKDSELETSETKKAQDAINADWAAGNDAIRNQLDASSAQLQADWAAREQADEQRRNNLDKNVILAQEFEKMRPEQIRMLQDSGLGAFQDIVGNASSYGDLANYLKMNTNLEATDFVSSDEAQRYNRINALLGNSVSPIEAGKIAPDYTFDVGGASDFVSSIIKGRAEEQARLTQAQIEADALIKAQHEREIETARLEAEKKAIEAQKAARAAENADNRRYKTHNQAQWPYRTLAPDQY